MLFSRAMCTLSCPSPVPAWIRQRPRPPDSCPAPACIPCLWACPQLLAHENTDLGIEAVSVLSDMTDADELGDNEEEARVLVDAIVDNNGLELLGQSLARLNEGEPEEAAGVHNTLSVLENLVEVRTAAAFACG